MGKATTTHTTMTHMNTLRFFFCICFFCFSLGFIDSQETDKTFTKRNSFYGEFLGTSGSVCSINYDRILKQNENSLIDLSLGFGYFPFFKEVNPIIGIPISINLTNGLGNHHFEIGAGLTYNSGIVQRKETVESYGSSLDSYSITESLQVLLFSFRIGYKYQKPNGGLFFRLGLTPLLKLKTFSKFDNDNSIPLFGLGVGYTM
jgi:hypothetical protein